MSEEFKNEFDENKETETDNVNTQEETETVFEDNASKPEETTNESAVTQEPGNAPTPENPVYARAYQPHEQRESTKEEWYQEAQQEQKQQQSYMLSVTAPESKKPNRSWKEVKRNKAEIWHSRCDSGCVWSGCKCSFSGDKLCGK